MKINEQLDHLARDITWFKPDPRNARKHNDRNVKAIMDSLRVFGQQKPVVALEDGTVIAGNGTLQAARALGAARLACVVFPDEDAARAFAIVDNRTAELAEWDLEVLGSTLTELRAADMSLDALGFTEYEAGPLMNAQWSNKPVDPNYVPPQPSKQHTVTFTPEQWNTISAHVERARGGSKKKSDAECIVEALALVGGGEL